MQFNERVRFSLECPPTVFGYGNHSVCRQKGTHVRDFISPDARQQLIIHTHIYIYACIILRGFPNIALSGCMYFAL